MNKRITVVFFILFVFSFIFASTNDSRFIIGSGNDKYTFGISKNDDDGLSFSGHIEYDFSFLKIKLDMDAYTDRGSWPNGEYRSGRLDVVSLSTLAHHSFPFGNIIDFHVDGIVGLSTIGKIYFDSVQNSHHEMVGVESTDMPYDWEKLKLSPMIGVNFAASSDLGAFRYSAHVDFLSSIFFVTRVSTYVGISAFDEILSFNAGYKYAKNFSESQTIETVTSVKKGAFTKIAIDAKPFMLEWEFYPQTGFGYGTYHIDLMPVIKNEVTWKKSEVFFDYSWTKLFDMDIMKAEISTPITKQLAGVFEIGFVSGFPVTSSSETRVQRNYSLFEFGVSYTPFRWYVSPYVQAQVGLGTFQIVYMNRTDPNKSSTNDVLPRTYVFSSDFRIGLNLLPEGLIAFGNSTCQFQLYGGSRIIPGATGLTKSLMLDKSHSADWKAKVFSLYWGYGLSVGIDLEDR